jgi:hypothetical protein
MGSTTAAFAQLEKKIMPSLFFHLSQPGTAISDRYSLAPTPPFFPFHCNAGAFFDSEALQGGYDLVMRG